MTCTPPTLEPCVLGGDIVQIQKGSLVQEHVFRHVFSDKTWKSVLSEEDRERLRKLLPPLKPSEQDSAVHKLFNLQNIKFGNPLKRFHKSLKRNHLHPENYYYRQLKKKSMYQTYKQELLQRHSESLQTLLLLRQKYLDEIQDLTEEDIDQSLNPKWRDTARGVLNLPASDVDEKARSMYHDVLGAVKRHCADDYSSSSDEDERYEEVKGVMAQSEMRSVLSRHNKRRTNKEIAPTLDTRGTTINDVMDRVLNDKHDSEEESESVPVPTQLAGPVPSKKSKIKVVQCEKKQKPKSQKADEQPVAASLQSQSSVSSQSQSTAVTYQNVLELLKSIMSSTQGSLYKELSDAEIATEMNIWQESEAARLCPWASVILDWQPHISDILTVLSEHEGNPLVVKTASENWKWVKEEGDSKARLISEWMRVLDNVPSLMLIMGEVTSQKPNDDRPESHYGETFRQQEAMRFAHPHRCFTYRLNCTEFIVGPVKGVYDKVSQNSTNKAREHALLVNDRPSYVTILTLVRDAAARLPKGEGTRYEICDLLKQSQFISDTASDNHINTVVSGALDRLHYEKDPCVKFDSARKNWMYLHGDRTAEELELSHQAQGAALKAKKAAKPSKSLQAVHAAALAANRAAVSAEQAEKSVQRTVPNPPINLKTETQLAEQSIMEVDTMSQLLANSVPTGLTAPALPKTQTKLSGQPPISHQMRAIKLDPSTIGDGGSRLIGIQVPRPAQRTNQERSSSALPAARQMSASGSLTSAPGQRANQMRAPTETTPGLMRSSSLPKGAAVFYQRIATPPGSQAAMMQRVLSASPTTSSSAGSSVMHRIVGNSPGGATPVLARLVQTSNTQKGGPGGARGGAIQQQFTHVQLPGGERVALPLNMGSAGSRAVQIMSGSGSTSQNRANVVQVHNMGGGMRKVGGVTHTVQAVKTTGQQSVSSQLKLSNLQQQLQSGQILTTTAAKGGSSLLTGQSDGKGGHVQLVKALISSSEGKPGSQAYILTANSGQRASMLSTKSHGSGKSAMIARVLQPDGSLTSVQTGSVAIPSGAKSILTTVSSAAGAKRTANTTMIRHVSSSASTLGYSSLVRSTPPSLTSGEIPRRIEQSELSPSAVLDIENDDP